MSKGFNLTAELNLRGPSNLRTVVSNIKKQVGNITANITPTVSRSNIRTIATDIRSQLGNIGVPLNVNVSRASIQNISKDIRNRLSGTDIPISVRINRSSLSSARRDIAAQLGNVNANVNINISAVATRNAAGLNRNLTALNQTLNQTTTSATNASAAIQSFTAAMRGAAGISIRNINIGLNTTGANATNAASNVRQLGGEIENFGRQAGLAVRRFAAFTTVTSVFYGLARSIRFGVSSFIEFDKQLVRALQVTGDNINGINKLATTITNLSSTYGVSSRELATVSVTLAQAGLTAKETSEALKSLAMSALAPSFDDLNSTVEGSIALMRQFGISTNQLQGALGSINSVAAKFAVEASDIIAAIQRTGGVFAAASKGVSEGTEALNEFISVFTSVRATTRESAETIATGLRTIFTRIQRGDTIEALKQFGVNLTDVEGKFVGAYKAVELLSSGLSQLDPRDLRFSQIVEELGGFRQIGKVIPLIQQFSTAQEALKIAQSGSGSLAEDAAKGQLALAVQIAKVREEFLALIRSIGDTSSFRTLVKLGLDLASSLIQVADAAKAVIPIVGLFGAIRGAQAIAGFSRGFVGGVGGVGGGRGAPVRRFAVGGYVPGVGNRDTVPAMLTPGEFVIRKKAVQTIGVNKLQQMNKYAGGGKVPKFASGGYSDDEWLKEIESIRRKYKLSSQFEIDRMSPTEKKAYEDRLGQIAFSSPSPGREKKALQAMQQKAARKSKLGLFFSAAGMKRGPKAPPGAFQETLSKYQGADGGLTSVKPKFIAWGKGQGSFADVIKGSEAKIREKLAGSQLDQFNKLISSGSLSNYISSGGKMGHIPPLKKAIYSILGVTGKNTGGIIQKFNEGTEVKKKKKPPIPVTDEMKQNIDALKAKAGQSILASDRVGLAILNRPKTNFKPASVRKSSIIKQAGSQYKGLLRTALSDQSMIIDKEAIGENVYTDFKVAIEDGLMAGVNTATSLLSSKYPLPKSAVSESQKKNFLAGLNNAAKGNLFEQILSSMKNKGKWDAGSDPQAPFDFIGGMGDAGRLFPRVGSLRYVDAKASNVSNKDVALKIANQALREIGVVSGKKQPKQPLTQTETGILSDLSSRIPEDFNRSATASTIRQNYGLNRNGLTRRGLKKSLEIVAKSGKTDEFVKAVFGSIQKNNLGGFIQKLVTGGDVKGISSSQAKSAILGKQLSGAEMVKAARRAGYDIEELDNGLVQLSRNNKIMHTMSRVEVSKLLGSIATGYSRGGLAKAPLIDDILNANGTILPRPGSAIQALIRAGGGAVDIDRTLKRTIGDKAYGMAKNPKQQSAALEKYFRDPQARLKDIISAPLTTFGQELKTAIQTGQLKPNKLSIISKSQRTPGVAEYLSQLFGIPVANMVFTQGGSKEPALEALRTKGPRINRIQKFAFGGSVGEDTVPALLTPGEFVINKKAASRLGSSRLHRLNRADKISGFNAGGEVGSVPRFSSGGDVQRFFLGGGAQARPGSSATTENLMIGGNVTTQLREMINALQELGVASSSSADLLRRTGRISVQAANAAYEADILRMRVAGAPMQAVIEAETRLANMRQQAQIQIRAQRQLSGIGGAQLQNIESVAQQRLQQLIARRQAGGLEVDEAFMRRAEGAAYTRAARQGGLSPRQTAGLTGNDLRQYINSAMGDPRTFEQMNRQFETSRRRELLAQINAERGATTDRREIANRVREASRLATEEANIRRQTLNQTRGAGGPGATGGQRMQQGMFMASFALPMLGQMLAGDPSRAGSSGGAAMSAGMQGGFNTFAMGTMIASMFPPGLGQGLAFAATAAAAVGQAFIDARNATIEFEKNLAAKKVEMALEDTGRLFEKLAKDVKDIDVQNAIGQKLIEASVATQRSIEMQATTAKAFWINMIDAFAYNGRESAERSQVLERFGTSAYLSSTTFGQSIAGTLGLASGSGTASERAELNRSMYIQQMIPEQSRELSKQYAAIADNTNRLIEEKIRSGVKIEEYINTDEFKKLSDTVALSNAAVAEQVLRIRTSTSLTDAQKAAQERLIITTYAEKESRKRAAVITRELQMKEVQQVTTQLSRSLERMFQNMEQAINKTNFGLEKMARDLDLVSSSLTGQAKAGEGAIKAINILQNPRAYGAGEVGAARSQAAGFFGGNSNIIKGLLTLGDDIETTIMSTINKTVKETEGDSPAKIAIAIEKSVSEKLQTLQLPQDVSEKLAREVKVALEKIRKDGRDEKIDFTQIEEELKDLSRVLDSTRRAQEVALKVLENWQNSLNSYTSSINTLTDLQIDFQARLRKSTELVIDSQNNLARTLGKDIRLETLVDNRNALVRQQTGGAISPRDIFRNINRLEAQRSQQEGAVDVARQGGPSRMKDFMIMSNNLKLTNVALRENYDALKNLAENSDIASAALNKIQEAQQRQQGKVGFIEKLVTSTPEEFESLNRAFIRLQNNANGQINTINNSVGAQKAYIEAIENGATAAEAMRAAQTAFANERRDTLSALNDLLPFLGGGQQANQIRANTLESMLMESGIGVSPMFQEVLNALRNPELDPETQRAIALYQEANQLQITANSFLNQINNKLQEETADKAAKAIADALKNTILTFKNAEQADLNRGVIPQNRATGGIIYASNGAFAPRGTDTVPAMLTPGEFVVNKNATAKNLPLLKSINSQKFSSGGKVKYYAGGGLVSSYLSAKASSREDFQRTKDELLNLDDDLVNKVLTTGSNKSGLWYLPNTYIRKPEAGKQTPDSTQNMDQSTYDGRNWYGRRNDNIYNLGGLHNDSGEILPGHTDLKLTILPSYDGPYPYVKRSSVAGSRMRTPLEIHDGESAIIMGMTTGTDIDLPTKKYNVQEFDKYKNKIAKLQDNKIIDKISWIENPASRINRQFKSIKDSYPENITPTEQSKNNLDPNSNKKHWVLYGSDSEPTSTIFDYAKIFEGGWRNAYGVVTGTANSSPQSLKFMNGQLSESADTITMKGTIFDIDKNNAIDPPKAKSTFDYHRKQFGVIKKTVLASQDNFKNLPLEDSEDLAKYNTLQQQLNNLYNNFSPHETFTKLDLFSNPLLKNANSLLVTANNGSTRADITKYIVEQQTQLAEGEKPNIVVGLSSPALPPDLQQLTKDWVKKSEFDIFPDDGVGAIKKFPFLVNVDPNNLGKGFTERAKRAILNQQNKISEKTVFDNRKMRLALGIGKSIDLPYSATYTKYSGPLWDNITKSFSDDPNKQLKDLYLPEDKNIFSGLDIANQRLYSRQPFDISSFAASSIPDGPINQLIDLVSNNGDRNQIDQVRDDIIKNSTLTFPHKGEKITGSLIKLQNEVGQQIFRGYSPLPSTTFGFGEFLADSVVEYAKQTKQQAQAASGKISDSRFGQEIIGDNPMETVRVLQQLTQGSLQLFGRRPIPGLQRGWLSDNIRSLQGILPRGGRTSISRLANNDQARVAAGIIRNVISNAGEYVSNLSSRTNNPQVYNGLKDTYGLMWGAFKAFDSISRSDTRQLAQLLNNNSDIENIFRTLGASATFEKAAATPLSEDYKALLGNQLVGSKITTVGADGSIKQVDAIDASPPKVDNYSDLMNLALNPYNEFSSRTVRSSVFDKLIGDISTAVDNRGMPYFEPNTSNFLISSLDSLKKWYGGDGVWLGQDYLFDKAANADPVNRGQQFLQNLDASRGLYDMANMAHRNLGGSIKYGDLPGDIWLKNRVEAGNFATGGMVYAAGGTLVNFQPRGTDTVPAMLTPGEFVVNRAATQKNLPLLKSINNNTYMADGGLLEAPKVVQGVTIPGKDKLSPRINRIDKNIAFNTSGISVIQKDIKDIKDIIKNSLDKLMSDQKSLTDSIDIFKNDTIMIAGTLMNLPGAMNDQMLVALRQLWNQIGNAIMPTIRNLIPNVGAAPWPAPPFNKGGIVYANKGRLIGAQPKGTDTVPAMLTPGEFVVNKDATQKNLPLLKAINNGSKGYHKGGSVYLQDGGLTPDTKKILTDLINRGYNLDDIISGKITIPGISIQPNIIESQDDSLLSNKPAPDIETYLKNPRLWNGFKDSSGFWWHKRGESVISAYGPPPALPSFQERMQAFESVLSAFAGAGGIKGSGGKLADVRGLPAGMSMQRNVTGPLGTKVGIPYTIGRPDPNYVSRANKKQITLDAIRDPITGEYFVSNTQPKAIKIPTQPQEIVNNLRDNSALRLGNIGLSSNPTTLKQLLSTSSNDPKTSRQADTIRQFLDNPEMMTSLSKVLSEQNIDISQLAPLSSGAESLVWSYGNEVIKLGRAVRPSPLPVVNPITADIAIPGSNSRLSREARLVTEGVTTRDAQAMFNKIWTEYDLFWHDAGARQMGFHPETGQPLIFDGSFSPVRPGTSPRRVEPRIDERNVPLPPPPPSQRSGLVEMMPAAFQQGLKQSPKPPPKVITDIFDKVTRQMNINLGPELSISSLQEKLRGVIGTEGVPKTLADILGILGMSPEQGLPDNFNVSVDKHMTEVGGFWRESTKTMALQSFGAPTGSDPLKFLLSLGGLRKRQVVLKKIIFHEFMHNLIKRFGDDAATRYYDKLQQNMDTIIPYMQNNPQLMEGYDASTVGNGIFYLLRSLAEIPGKERGLGFDAKSWNLLFQQRDNLPLSPQQIKAYRDFAAKNMLVDDAFLNGVPDLAIEGFPTIPFSQILEDTGGKFRLDPDLMMGQSVRAMNQLVEISYPRTEGLPPIGSKESVDQVRAVYESFTDNWRGVKFADGSSGFAEFDTLLKSAREEFATQLFQNLEQIDQTGLTMLTQLLDTVVNDSNIFDSASFYDRIRNALNQRPDAAPIGEMQPVLRKDGGLIYASKGQLIDFQPRGTDTVPAMLTPGEFVVNRAATQKNLPLLKAINSGVGGYSSGGVIYAQDGLRVPYDFGKPTKPPERPLFPIGTNRDTNKQRGMASAEIGAPGPRTPEGDRLRALRQQQELQDIEYEDIFGNRRSRKETEVERDLRIINSFHPDMTPGVDASFYVNFAAAWRVLEDIASGYVAGGGSRLTGRGNAKPNTITRSGSKTQEQDTEIRRQIQYSNVDDYKSRLTGMYYSEFANIIRNFDKRDAPYTLEPKERKNKEYIIKSQIQQLNKKYEQGISTADRDYKSGQMFEGNLDYNPKRTAAEETILGSVLGRLRGVVSDPRWKLNESNDSSVNDVVRLGVYDSSVFQQLASELMDLGGKTGELPATLSGKNIIYGDDGISLKNVGAIAPITTSLDSPGTLGRIPMDSFSKALFAPIDSMLSRLRSGYNKSGYDLLGGASDAYRGVINQEAQVLAEQILRSTRYPIPEGMSLADNYYIDLATRLLEQTRETQQKYFDRSLQEYSPSSSGTSKTSRIKISNPNNTYTDLQQEYADGIRLNREEIIAYYQGGSNWGRISAIPGKGDIYSIDTALVKQGTLVPLLDSLVKHISSIDDKSALSFRSSSYSAEAQAIIPRLIDIATKKYKALKIDPEGPDTIENLAFRVKPLEEKEPNYKNKGGIIYASKGQLINFEPRGTDTVPAMLTPGEFVVNRAATQKNLPLLKAINNGVGGYSDGGVVYLQAGGRPGAGPRDKDEVEAYKRGGLRDRLTAQSKDRFDYQTQTSRPNREGRLWIFTIPREGLLTDSDGNPLNNGLQYILKDGNGKPSNNLSTESLAAMDISKVFSLRANSAANAKKAVQEIDNGKNNRVESSLAIDAISAISKAKQQQGRKSFDQKIIDELSYQIQTNKDIFSVFNPEFFNVDPAVVDKYTDENNQIIDAMDLNNPASVMAGLAALGPKAKRVKNRKDYLEEIISNNQQALAVLKAANLDFTKDTNTRKSFGGKLPTEIHEAQIRDGGLELISANNILQNLMNNPKIQRLLQNPATARSIQMMLMPQQGFGVPQTSFENPAQSITIPEKLARGGIAYANKGQLINFQPKGTDTIPAMLTPGEFVVNRNATQKNLPLLQGINNGQVSYLANGTPGSDMFESSLKMLTTAINLGAKQLNTAFLEAVQQLTLNIDNRPDIIRQSATQTNGVSNITAANIDLLGSRLDRFIEQLQAALPPVIRVEGQHDVNVVINGAAALQNLLQGPISSLIQTAIQSAFNAKSRENEGN
jgi:TP901 family phage tail tape measure protein